MGPKNIVDEKKNIVDAQPCTLRDKSPPIQILRLNSLLCFLLRNAASQSQKGVELMVDKSYHFMDGLLCRRAEKFLSFRKYG